MTDRVYHNAIVTQWTPARIERLKELRAAGLSGTQIADRLGPSFTRCAVLGKLYRLGVRPGQKPPRPPPKKRKRPWKPPVVHVKPAGVTLARSPAAGQGGLLVPAKSLPEPRMRRVKLLRLKPHWCKWPLGEPGQPGFCFCGADALPQRVYCAIHDKLAYQKEHKPHVRARYPF